MLRRLLAMFEARRARIQRQQHDEHVRQVEAERLRRHPDEAGYEWGVQVMIQGRLLPRRRRLRRRRREEPEEEPEPEGGGDDVIFL